MSESLPTMTGVIPHLICNGASDAIEFYKQAFGATEIMRLPGPDGRLMHASVTINGAIVMMMDEMKEIGGLGPNALGGTPVTLHLHVGNADEAIARAETAGATVTMPATDMFWGDRYGQVKDPWGHMWSIAHPLGAPALSPEEMAKAAEDAMCGQPAET